MGGEPLRAPYGADLLAKCPEGVTSTSTIIPTVLIGFPTGGIYHPTTCNILLMG